MLSTHALLASHTGCRIHEDWTGRTAVLTVTGALDMLTSSALDAAVAAVLTEHPEALVVDISGVKFLGLSGMNSLITAQLLAGDGIEFLVVAPASTTARPLHLTGIDDIIAVRPTLGSAMVGLDA